MEETFIAISIVMLIIGIIVVIAGLETKCPNCGKWFAKETINREVTGQRDGWKEETKTEETRDAEGNLIQRRYIPIQKRVRTTDYRDHYKCSECGHEWHSDWQDQTGSFDE